MKYCPFNLKITQTNQDVYENEDGNLKSHNHVLIESQEPTKCMGKECACWSFGRCRRRT